MGKHGTRGNKRLLALRWAGLAFCVLFAAAIFLPAGYIVVHAGHAHVSYDAPCLTCDCLVAAQTLLRQVSVCATQAAGISIAIFMLALCICFLSHAGYFTPVALKVRLNH